MMVKDQKKLKRSCKFVMKEHEMWPNTMNACETSILQYWAGN